MTTKTSKYVILFSLFFSAVLAVPTAFAKVECTDLPANLSLGMTSSKTDGNVGALQKYLQEKGYLDKNLPTGRFGDATVSAVKKLQKNNGISTTGTAGSQTRAVIKKFSCSASVAPNKSSSDTSISSLLAQLASAQSAIASATASQNTAPEQTAVVANENNTVTSPVRGETLTVGQTYRIVWQGGYGSNYDILIENNEGVGVGYLAKSVSKNQYDWQVGNIFISGSASTTLPGEYRIRLRTKDSGGKDQTSGIFLIADKPVIINSVMPDIAVADDNSTVIIYGSGFGETATIAFDASSIPIYPTSVSADGKIILFTIPTYFYPGVHTLKVINHYDIDATSTPQNTIKLKVTRPL